MKLEQTYRAPSGRFLVAAYYKTGQVTVHRILGEGRPSDEPLHTYKRDPCAHDVAFDRRGQFLFVPHTRTNCIDQFCIDPKTGTLTPGDPPKLQRGESIGPRHLRFHPHADFAYGSNEQALSVSVYRFDSNAGTLSEIETIASVPVNQRHWELFDARTGDGGKTWQWTPLTQDSTSDQLRPIIPPWNNSRRIVLWTRGTLSSDVDYRLHIMAMIEER